MLKELFLGKKSLVDECDKDTIDILRLFRSENVGPRTFYDLIKFFGSSALALENIGDFARKGGRSKPTKIFSMNDAIREIEKLKAIGAGLISYKSPFYPPLLLQTYDYPPVLSYLGNKHYLNHTKIVSIVGARNASINGRSFASTIAKELAANDYIICSGPARGIDTAAHQSSEGKTIAVVAGGIDYTYPPENEKLYHEIVEKGAIIAELPIGAKPLGQNFPQRNRLISGIASGVVIVEASLNSGSLITAKYALEQNREIFAVPGFPLDPRSQGTNKLIKDGAYLIESTQDILDSLPTFEKIKRNLNENTSINDNFKHNSRDYPAEVNEITRQNVRALLSSTPSSIEKIVEITSLPLAIIQIIILELEIAGYIVRTPGNKISLVYS